MGFAVYSDCAGAGIMLSRGGVEVRGQWVPIGANWADLGLPGGSSMQVWDPMATALERENMRRSRNVRQPRKNQNKPRKNQNKPRKNKKKLDVINPPTCLPPSIQHQLQEWKASFKNNRKRPKISPKIPKLW